MSYHAMLDKRGELTSAQIIMIVLAIAGFVIILIFFTVIFDNDGQGLREACHFSVLARAGLGQLLQAAAPLECVSLKHCMTDERLGTCDEFNGEEHVFREHLSGNLDELGDRLQIRSKIEEKMAEEMVACWNMMGQGQLDLFGNAKQQLGLDDSGPTCVICSRIAFDENLVKSGVVNETNLNIYLETHNYSDTGGNYIEYFTNKESKAFLGISKIEENFKDDIYESVQLKGNKDEIQFAIVYSQYKVDDWKVVLEKWGIGVGGGAFMVPGFLKRPLFLIGGVFAAGATYNAYANQKAAVSWCGEFTGIKEREFDTGCTIMQVVNYNVEDINALCTSIQGIP